MIDLFLDLQLVYSIGEMDGLCFELLLIFLFFFNCGILGFVQSFCFFGDFVFLFIELGCLLVEVIVIEEGLGNMEIIVEIVVGILILGVFGEILVFKLFLGEREFLQEVGIFLFGQEIVEEENVEKEEKNDIQKNFYKVVDKG